ncbi:bifunctional riboflavin kinase/FAD synthetase [Spirulina subsalsa FACHB-351]|uniref:Riboflavin biosynthesis protein n=1 Tax=Spirulina subsalsa FACHB-351 TaxID=234711 RepID=A0ABT3L3G1_9CYAN|nr:bifunctional riboflavin kinase/FAD synthetase [Spirulina subsalsa FACHB-351]
MTSSPTTVLTPTAIALGNFDGIHRGHQKVVRPVLDPVLDSDRVIVHSHPPTGQERGSVHVYPTVVTFKPHPQEFFSGQKRQLLTPLGEKAQILERLGIEQLVLLPFDQDLAALSPQDFVEHLLINQLQATRIAVGADFRFGHKRAGTVEDLQAIAQKFGCEVLITPLHRLETERISSSQIRQALINGDILRANNLLGRSYSITGTVVTGQQLGRTIGFPTANLEVSEDKLLPRHGVYSVRVWSNPEASPPSAPQIGVMNLGCRPTVDNSHQRTLEIHILGWSGDLYGQTLTITLEQFLRPEQKFSSLDELKQQIAQDCLTTRQLLHPESPHEV